jgi:hypothetical protein
MRFPNARLNQLALVHAAAISGVKTDSVKISESGASAPMRNGVADVALHRDVGNLKWGSAAALSEVRKLGARVDSEVLEILNALCESERKTQSEVIEMLIRLAGKKALKLSGNGASEDEPANEGKLSAALGAIALESLLEGFKTKLDQMIKEELDSAFPDKADQIACLIARRHAEDIEELKAVLMSWLGENSASGNTFDDGMDVLQGCKRKLDDFVEDLKSGLAMNAETLEAKLAESADELDSEIAEKVDRKAFAVADLHARRLADSVERLKRDTLKWLSEVSLSAAERSALEAKAILEDWIRKFAETAESLKSTLLEEERGLGSGLRNIETELESELEKKLAQIESKLLKEIGAKAIKFASPVFYEQMRKIVAEIESGKKGLMSWFDEKSASIAARLETAEGLNSEFSRAVRLEVGNQLRQWRENIKAIQDDQYAEMCFSEMKRILKLLSNLIYFPANYEYVKQLEEDLGILIRAYSNWCWERSALMKEIAAWTRAHAGLMRAEADPLESQRIVGFQRDGKTIPIRVPELRLQEWQSLSSGKQSAPDPDANETEAESAVNEPKSLDG